ncbi:phenol hydroxylase subunit [Pseudomonas japonica]|uniref:Phenol 2-monooxygenase P0 subunit n=1 Tax=Pseudomonas japonica TaxID=256466 RepID=A0A239KH28_9PSED|nr:phenol hydroxylase subunit [Pseudomonas japonica]SNT17657.1 phenol 2-monooxygenase P0 subunit [Pseudomonas japonica]
MSANNDVFNQLPRYVRVRSDAKAAFVEFDFAIGYPELYVELVLPQTAFAVFCEQYKVQHMDERMCAALDADAQRWRYGESASAQ